MRFSNSTARTPHPPILGGHSRGGIYFNSIVTAACDAVFKFHSPYPPPPHPGGAVEGALFCNHQSIFTDGVNTTRSRVCLLGADRRRAVQVVPRAGLKTRPHIGAPAAVVRKQTKRTSRNCGPARCAKINPQNYSRAPLAAETPRTFKPVVAASGSNAPRWRRGRDSNPRSAH